MSSAPNRRFLLVRRPNGTPVAEDFELVTRAIPEPGEGQVVIENHYASLDPAIRGWMDDKPSYMPPIPLGDPVRASVIGKVHASRNPAFKPGDDVLTLGAIENYTLAEEGGFTQKIDPGLVPSVTNYLSVLGAVGQTAYWGLLDVAQPKAGETVLVSGAAGAVGSLVGQIAKIHGCRAVGIAGGAEKCARLTGEFGFDAAVDYKGKTTAELVAAVREACPDGLDVYFENVGGPAFDAALQNMNEWGRVALCGLISQYNKPGLTPGPDLWPLIANSVHIRGFVVKDYVPRFMEAGMQIAQWLMAGQLKHREDIDEGIENALASFLKLFSGANEGKLILKL